MADNRKVRTETKPDTKPVAASRADRRSEAIRARRHGRREVAERRRRQRLWTRVGLIGAAVLVIAAVGYFGLSALNDRRNRQPPDGVQTFEDLQQTHVQERVSYPQTPPVGGEHSPVWQNCGYYAAPVANENAVHSLEHGAVWIAYQPDLPADQVEELRSLAEDTTHVLVSPYPDLPSPVVASAWGKQLALESAMDSDLDQFVRAFRQGPQTPEPGASCTGGTSATQ